MAVDRLAFLKNHYGFDFPPDLAEAFAVLKKLRPLEPLLALKEVLGIYLVGPFEVLAGRFDRIPPVPEMLLHWRFCNDAPEFFTLMVRAEDDFHWGYWLTHPGHLDNQSFWTSADPLTPKNQPLFEGEILGGVRELLEERQASIEEAQLADLGLPQDEETLGRYGRFREKLGKLATQSPAWQIPDIGSAYLEKMNSKNQDRLKGKRKKAGPTPKDFAVALSEMDQAISESDWEKAGAFRSDLWSRIRPSRQVGLLQRCEQFYLGTDQPILARVCAQSIKHHKRKWLDIADAGL